MIVEELKVEGCQEVKFFKYVENQDIDLYKFSCGFIFPNFKELEGERVEKAKRVHAYHHENKHIDRNEWRMWLDARLGKFICDCDLELEKNREEDKSGNP